MQDRLAYGLVLAVVALLALLAGVLAQRWWHAGAPPPEVRIEPTAALHDLEGKTRDLGEWRGQVLVVNFWATWCPPCREEMPAFVQVQEALGGQGVRFIGVALDEPEAVRGYLQETPVNYPVLIGGQDAADWAARLGNVAGVLPFTAVFDREGRLAHTKLGLFRREALTAAVRPLVGVPAPGKSP
jgi:thiol-disulfide isomerase/thioredoxin